MSFTKPFQKKVDFILDLIAVNDSHNRERLGSELAINSEGEKQLIVFLGSFDNPIFKSGWHMSVESMAIEINTIYHNKMLKFLSDPYFKDTNKTTDIVLIKKIKELFLLSAKEIVSLRK